MSVPVSRSFPSVLRDKLRAQSVTLLIGRVVSVPNSRHVVVQIGGTNVTVCKLASYTTPVAGDAAYILSAAGLMIALGTCK